MQKTTLQPMVMTIWVAWVKYMPNFTCFLSKKMWISVILCYFGVILTFKKKHFHLNWADKYNEDGDDEMMIR